MKKVILALVLFVAYICNVAAQTPAYSFDNTEHNFGTIKEADGKVTCTFVLTNTGTADLNMTTVEPSCSCIVLNVPATTLKAGQKVTITATFDPFGRKGDFTKRIYVHFNNSKETSVNLLLKGSILQNQ